MLIRSNLCYNADMSEELQSKDKPTRGTKLLPNGAVYDLDRGRIVANPGGGKHAITSENAHAMHARRLERKHKLINAALADGVQSNTLRSKYGEAAWLAEVAQVQQAISTTPDAPGATRAAEFLMRHSGLDELPASARPPAGTVTVQAGGEMDIVAVIMRRRLAAGDVVDAEYTDTDIEQVFDTADE